MITVERTYRATLEDVWDLWTTKDGFESWWGPVGFRADVHELNAKNGGTLRYDMVADTPEMIAELKKAGQPTSHPTTSTFSELEPHKRLVLTNRIDFIPGVEAYEARIIVELKTVGDSVRMTVSFDPLHSDEFSQMQKEGFESQLTKLDERFSR